MTTTSTLERQTVVCNNAVRKKLVSNYFTYRERQHGNIQQLYPSHFLLWAKAHGCWYSRARMEILPYCLAAIYEELAAVHEQGWHRQVDSKFLPLATKAQ
jgi:hypothetical protein